MLTQRTKSEAAMRKLWSYGNRPKPYTPNKRRDLRYIKKTARNRERAMPSLVADKQAMKKETQA